MKSYQLIYLSLYSSLYNIRHCQRLGISYCIVMRKKFKNGVGCAIFMLRIQGPLKGIFLSFSTNVITIDIQDLSQYGQGWMKKCLHIIINSCPLVEMN